MAAGLASLRYTLEHRLMDHAAIMGDRLISHLRQIQANSRVIGDVRGRGLMVGVEIVNPEAPANHRGIHPQYSSMARQIQAECLRRGLILELGGRYGSVVRFLPPLIVTADQIDSIGGIFQQAVKAAEQMATVDLVGV